MLHAQVNIQFEVPCCPLMQPCERLMCIALHSSCTVDSSAAHLCCSSSVHTAEKAKLLTAFAAIASQCQVRISIASGDVHLCAFGFMQSKGQAGQVQALDPGFIPQIVTSAIGNKPPGNMVVSYIEKCTSLRNIGEHFQEGVVSAGPARVL